MSPRSKEQFDEIRENSRRHILGVAFKLFAENGYKSTSIAHLAAEAGISKGLIYNYWASKNELLLDVMRQQILHIEELYPYVKSRIASQEFLTRYLHDTFRYLNTEKQTWRLLYSLMLQPDVSKLILPLMEDIKVEYLQNFERHFAELGFRHPASVNLIFQAAIDGIMIGNIIAGESMLVNEMGADYLLEEMERIFIHQSRRDE